MLGAMTPVYLVEIEDDVGYISLTDFYSCVRQFLSEIIQRGVSETNIHDLTWLDPREQINSSASAVRRLAQKFLVFVPDEKVDQLEEECFLYQTTEDLPMDTERLIFIGRTWNAQMYCIKTI